MLWYRGYAPKQLKHDHPLFDRYLEDVLERLDEDFGNPEADGYTEPTSAMKAAMATFARVVVKEYKVWMCGQCGDAFRVKGFI